MSLVDNILDIYNPVYIAQKIASNMRKRRLELNLTQDGLARRSGVSLGSVKRFEGKAEISLKNLIEIAIALNVQETLIQFFAKEKIPTIDEVLKQRSKPQRKRGRLND